jgi:hypothetical protein
MYLISLSSPMALFITYFFNACIAHNLFVTFYTYRNNFDQRMKIYKIIALVGGVITLILSVLFNNRKNLSNVQFTVSYYPFYFIALVYFLGGITVIYMIIKTAYVIRERGNFFSFLMNAEEDNSKNYLITLFVKRHLLFLLFFLIEFVPNNVILLLQIFMSYKICTYCSYYSICLYMMSLSCAISFTIKMTEPYMSKYIKIVFKSVFRQHLEVHENRADYIDLYNNDSLLDNNDAERKISNKDDFYNKGPLSSTGQNEIKMDDLSNSSHKRTEKTMVHPTSKKSTAELKNMADTLNVFTKEMEAADFFIRMIGITVSTEEDKQYDFDPQFGNKMKSYLPWEDEAYNSKSKQSEYTHKNLPEWLTKDTSKKIEF